MLIRRILVPLDGTEFAEAALGPARVIAERARAALELVTVRARDGVIVSGAPMADPALAREKERTLRHYLDDVLRRERGRSTTPANASLLEGDVSDALVAAIAEQDVDLVVMATHARGGLKRLWLGSTAEDLIRSAHVPLLLVPRPQAGDEAAAEHEGFHRVVVGLAGNDADDRVLDATFAVTDRAQATYTLLHVATFTLVPPAVLGAPSPPDELAALPPALDQAEVEQAQRYLEGIAAPLHAHGVAVDAQVETGRTVADAIVDHATRMSADLIALATRAPGAIERAALGSVADKVMRKARTAVLICPPLREG
ncbi:MAG TPA: universal stress protein [Gemmatimonadaceae bacterium]|nr:universal stress protein [Gemmatimonadaceae bacterium]